MPSVKQVWPGNGAHFSGLETSDFTSTDESCKNDDFMRSDCSTSHNFMYLHCIVGKAKVTALLDSGSSINIISRSFYDSVPETFKFDYQECAEMITMADNASIAVDGTASIQLCTPSKKSHIVPVYIFRDTSHPLILGAEYMRPNNVVLDFSKNSVFPNMKKSQKVRCKNTCVIQPNTESVLEGKLGTDVPVGTQGVCLGHSEMSHKGLLVAKGLVTCLSDHIVPVRIWNPSNEIVHVNKGSILCTFSICDNSVDVHCISPPKCAHVQLQSSNTTLSDRNSSVDAKQARSVSHQEMV